MACRLLIRMRIRYNLVEEQVQQILSYVQGGLESRNLSYVTVRKFLSDLKEEFDRGDNETMKVAELKKVEQESKTIEEFMQEFRRAIRESRHKKRLLIKEFKRWMNVVIKRKLMKAERSPRDIKQ